MSRQRRLGKGIDALLQGRDITSLEAGEINSVVSVPLDRVRPNPDQPRKTFAPETLQELARSIEERGIIQPILAEQQDDDTYVIIAGERRYRAAAIAGLTVVPVLPGVFSEDEKLEIALIENIQRQNLTPIEEARAYRELMERSGLNQEELAHRLGKSRPAVANSLRLLRLPEETQELANSGKLSAGHARTLLGLDDSSLIADVTRIITAEDLSVRALERLVTLVNQGRSADEAFTLLSGGSDAPATTTTTVSDHTVNDATTGSESSPGGSTSTAPKDRSESGGAPRKTVEMEEIQQRLMERLGTRVVLTGTNDHGKIEISYLSMDDLDRIVELVVTDD
ncbi:MAG: ParB/RepB/Spo0J family partition protein [Spirochaeta sp.]|nr:ParB/RepB/Spo0J family partition protein [Spirochaeta sp.]